MRKSICIHRLKTSNSLVQLDLTYVSTYILYAHSKRVKNIHVNVQYRYINNSSWSMLKAN